MKGKFSLGVFAVVAALTSQVQAEQITVKHELGTTVLRGVPKRVVVLGIGPLDALDAFGINPVGVTKFPGMPAYLKKYMTKAYPSSGSLFEPDFEKIYSEKPDLILMGPRNAKHYKELSKIAPTVMYTIDTSEGVWESTKDEWRMLGKIFHIEPKVNSKIAQLDKEFKAIHTYTQAHPERAMTVMSLGGNVSAFGADSRFGSIYKDFGFQPAYQTKKAESGVHGNLISFEFIQEKNPDVLFVIDKDKLVNHGKSNTKATFDNILIQSTKAYKQHKIDYLDVDAWYLTIAGVHSTEQMIQDIKRVVKLD